VAAGADLEQLYCPPWEPEMMWSRAGGVSAATPLMVAAASRREDDGETVRVLLELGADAKFVIDGWSAAMIAARMCSEQPSDRSRVARLRMLLAAGSSPAGSLQATGEILCDAARAGAAGLVGLLLARGASAEGEWAAKGRDAATEEKPSNYTIPLFCAAESGDVDCARLLLEAGADGQRRDSSKRTAMFYAGSVEMIRVLQAAGLSLEDADEFEWTPLTGAVGDGEESLPRVAALIEAGANVNATHDRGYTVFMSAVWSLRYPALLRLLAASGADVHAVSDLGYNAFHAAIDVDGGANAEESVRDTFGYLKELGVNIEHRDARDQTPLARAIDVGTGVEVRVLCELGADPNAVCKKHGRGSNARGPVEMPLLFHIISGSAIETDIKVEALLRAGADPLVRDADGFTPLMHVVASLCRDAADCEASYQAFFAGLGRVKLEGTPLPGGRDQFVAAVSPVIRAYVERFAGEIPVSKASEYAEEWRREKIACIVLLAAYEAWARRLG
jgi:ankyrin repeat protein